MKKTQLFFYSLLLIISVNFTSCQPDPIDIDLPSHNTKLVVFSQVVPDHYMIVGVSRSFSSLAGNPDTLSQDSTFLAGVLVTRALVTIRFGDRVETLEHIGNGMYASATLLQNYGQTYTLYVKDSLTGLSCTSTSTMLPLVDFDSIKPIVIRNSGDTSVFVEFSFTDVPGIDNYYLINTHLPRKDSTLGVASLVSVERKKPNITLLSDKLMTNGRYSIRQKLDVSAKNTLTFSLSNISEGYYTFLSAYQKSNKIFNQLTGEPINYPTNIVGGYGYFNTHNPSIKVFDLNEY